MADISKEESHIVGGSPSNSLDQVEADERIFSNQPPKTLGFIDIIAAAFNICNSWSGLAATLFLGIIQGGPVVIIYGIIICTVTVGASALSLAELAQRYPTAGGQYHWTWLLAPRKMQRGISYACATINMFAWVTICASICVIIPQIILGLAVFYNPNFIPHRWQAFLIYQAFNIGLLLYNIAILRRAAWTHDIGMAISLLCFFTFFIASLAIASPKQSSSFVWTTFVNQSGWSSNGLVFLTGLVNANFMYVGLDGAIHLAEDAKNAVTAVPWALITTIVIGFVTAFPFVVAMFYCIADPNAVLQSSVPIFEIWHQAVKSSSGATAMTCLLLLTGVFALNASQQTASRLTWSFARDRALIFSNQLGQIHPKLEVPVWALIFNSFVIFIIGCIYLGSTTAFSAIVGTSLILMQLTFGIPTALLMWRRRADRFLPEKGHTFRMGASGWLFNFITVAWTLLTLVLYCIPLSLPVTGSNMNYSCVVLGVMAIFAGINWLIHARKHYNGPRVDLERFRTLKPVH